MKSHRILKTFLLLSAFFVASLVIGAPRTVVASTTTPPLGSWTWCTETVVNGCIEAVTTTSPDKVTNTYFSASELPAGLAVSARCSGNGPASSCDGNKFENNANGVCTQRTTWSGGFTTPSIEMDIEWPGRSGWEITLRLSTGDFRPAFLIGHGTRSTQITSDGDGTYTFAFTSVMEFVHTAPMTQSRIPADIATFSREVVQVQLWPRDHLLSSRMPQQGTSPVQLTNTPCMYYPFTGAWAEANAQSFSWSYQSQFPPLAPTSNDSPIANKLTFMAAAPHYKPQVGNQPLEVIAARVQVFLPTAYFRSLGYETLDGFDSSSYSVVAADGQSTSPTVTQREDGLLINLGISHYSAPNPELTFAVRGNPLTSSDSLRATPPLNRPPSRAVVQAPTSKLFSVKKGATTSSSRIARELGVSVKSAKKVVLSVSPASKKVCRVSGLSVRATKKGNCTVILKVTSKNGKTKTYRQLMTIR